MNGTFLILAGGLLVIIIAVVIVAAEVAEAEDIRTQQLLIHLRIKF